MSGTIFTKKKITILFMAHTGSDMIVEAGMFIQSNKQSALGAQDRTGKAAALAIFS